MLREIFVKIKWQDKIRLQIPALEIYLFYDPEFIRIIRTIHYQFFLLISSFLNMDRIFKISINRQHQRIGQIIELINIFFIRIIHVDRKSTRLNSSHVAISYAVFCLKKKKKKIKLIRRLDTTT